MEARPRGNKRDRITSHDLLSDLGLQLAMNYVPNSSQIDPNEILHENEYSFD